MSKLASRAIAHLVISESPQSLRIQTFCFGLVAQ